METKMEKNMKEDRTEEESLEPKCFCCFEHVRYQKVRRVKITKKKFPAQFGTDHLNFGDPW